jgi:hypothetical protein
MSHILPIPFNGGYVSTGTGARDASDLETGELQKMTGGYYRKNDPNQVWNMPGRTEFGSAGTGAVKGIAICQFDEGGSDLLVASVGTTLMYATPGATGTFLTLEAGLNTLATVLTAAQQEDRWFLGNGYDDNLVLMPDGTTRLMGMKAVEGQPTLATVAVSAQVTTRPTTDAISFVGWVDPTKAYDGDDTTFSWRQIYHTVPSDHVWGHRFEGWVATPSPPPGRILKIKWGASVQGGGYMNIRKSEDGGSTFTYIYTAFQPPYSEVEPFWVESAIADTTDSASVVVIVDCGANPQDDNSTFRVYDIKIEYGNVSSVTTTLGGVAYATTEVYQGDGYQLESPPSKITTLSFTAKGSVVVTRPTLLNTAATHWRVYRVGDGVATTPLNYGRVADLVEINDTTWTDVFETPITEQAVPTLPVVSVGDLDFFRDSPPPVFKSMISWKGSICGISRSSPRTWFYSEGGRPESFPIIYQVISFPLDEHDVLVGQMAVGETLVLLCGGAVLAVDDLPRVTDGVFDAGNARPIKGHPGCVGEYAYTTFSVAGEPRGAWVSPFGVYVTNGQVCACLSTDLAWENEVNVPYLGTAVLRWDAKNVILWFEFDLDGDGLNDHEMPFHMAQAHSKGEARPKLGQPTAKATSCMASALIDSTHYRFTGHPSDGSVYVEESGSVDAATGDTVTVTVRSAQVAHDKVDLGIIKATLNHSNFGEGATGTLVTTLYRDSANTENSRSQSIRLDGNRGTTVGVGRAGELVDVTFEYSGSGSGGVGGVDLEVDGHGRSGSAARVTSSSATP